MIQERPINESVLSCPPRDFRNRVFFISIPTPNACSLIDGIHSHYETKMRLEHQHSPQTMTQILSPRLLVPLLVTGFSLVILAVVNSSSEDPSFRSLRRASASEESMNTVFSLSSNDLIGISLAALGLMIAAGGGIGGGGMLVPVFVLVLKLSPDLAVPLSNATIFGGAIANVIINAPKRHPETDRPLIDFDLIMILEPLTIAGALLGAHLNVLLPNSVIMLCLVILLSYTSWKTGSKAYKMHKNETKGWKAISTHETSGDVEMELSSNSTIIAKGGGLAALGEEDPLQDQPNDTRNVESRISIAGDSLDICKLELSSTRQLDEILEEERSVPTKTIAIITSMFLFILLSNIMKGGGGLESPLGIKCGSKAYWMAEGLVLLATLAVFAYARSYLLERTWQRSLVGFPYLDSDVKWDSRSTIVHPLLCTGAGLVAGLCGVGGGLIKAPLMLGLGVDPSVTTATSSTMILFTTFITTTSFLVFGVLQMDYAIVGKLRLWIHDG